MHLSLWTLLTFVARGRSKGGGAIAPPKTYESNFIHHVFLPSFGIQYSRFKANLPSIVLSQQCCEVYETCLQNITEIAPPSLTGWIRPCLCPLWTERCANANVSQKTHVSFPVVKPEVGFRNHIDNTSLITWELALTIGWCIKSYKNQGLASCLSWIQYCFRMLEYFPTSLRYFGIRLKQGPLVFYARATQPITQQFEGRTSNVMWLFQDMLRSTKASNFS